MVSFHSSTVRREHGRWARRRRLPVWRAGLEGHPQTSDLKASVCLQGAVSGVPNPREQGPLPQGQSRFNPCCWSLALSPLNRFVNGGIFSFLHPDHWKCLGRTIACIYHNRLNTVWLPFAASIDFSGTPSKLSEHHQICCNSALQSVPSQCFPVGGCLSSRVLPPLSLCRWRDFTKEVQKLTFCTIAIPAWMQSCKGLAQWVLLPIARTTAHTNQVLPWILGHFWCHQSSSCSWFR